MNTNSLQPYSVKIDNDGIIDEQIIVLPSNLSKEEALQIAKSRFGRFVISLEEI